MDPVYTLDEGRQKWAAYQASLAAAGYITNAEAFLPLPWKTNLGLAMDAAPGLTIGPASASAPLIFTTLVDPNVIDAVFAPTKAAQIIGEEKRGSWTDRNIIFEVVEHTGEVSSYGDRNNNGRAGINVTFPQRQSYLFQTIKEYGDLEVDVAGAARLNYVQKINASAADIMNRFLNKTYFFGVQGLQNYGLINDPSLGAAITPTTKTAGGTAWILNNKVNATCNEMYNDIQAVWTALVAQTMGLVEEDTPITLAFSPLISTALKTANSFGITLRKLLEDNFKNLTIETAVEYGARTAANPNGNAAGEMMQMIARRIGGNDTGFAAFNEKMREHPLVRDLSSSKQKVTGGTWGTVIAMPIAVASMVGL